MTLPSIAITVGDVAGIGVELAVRCSAMTDVNARCQPLLYGPEQTIRHVADLLSLPIEARIVDVGDPGTVSAGTFTAATGQASFDAFDRAIGDAISGSVAAVVTGPIQKEAWHAAGIGFPGHTEVLADRTGTTDFSMMLTSHEISCVLATIHIPLADVPGRLTTDSIVRATRLGAAALSRKLGRPAKVVICGLNPHAGENGLFSRGEEQNAIQPAVEQCRHEGIDVVGPVPPDTAFTPMMREKCDVYVCMYHDQGLIPLKALSFDDAVNVTLGLPIVRTSVDHGTAMSIAWQGTAKHQSMLSAIEMAVDLADG